MPALGALAAAFAFRVTAQFIQWTVDVPWLPAFDSWQSGAVPYGALLAAQVIILGAQGAVVAGMRDGRCRPAPRQAIWVLAFGVTYFGVMAFRLAASVTFAEGGWLDEPLPSVFHLVLAVFVILWALTGYPEPVPGRTPHLLRHGGYPLVTAGACGLFYVLAKSGLPSPIAAYVPVVLGVSAIVAMESRWPYRQEWRPTMVAAKPDAVFLLVVQIGLPAALAGGYALIADALADGTWQLRDLWPHGWPATLQVVLMVLLADLFRYPLHRAMHTRAALWRLHAVHHSPERLYWLNVGRFHPLEKTAQGLFDALPFVVVGVDSWALAGYFVFYAVNGFFQHSNADVELGPLNWLISGAELHRWHHSVDPVESGTNYGNNVIVWDVLFGTRARPPGEVDEIGNGDPGYPTGFVASMTQPFWAGES